MLVDKQRAAYAGAIALGFLLCVVAPVAFRFSPVCQPIGNKTAVEETHQLTANKATQKADTGNVEPIEFPWYCDIHPGDMALGFFTFCLVIVGFGAVRLETRQHFITHAPHLVVRNIRITDAEPGDPIKIDFEVINIGSSEAEILASNFETHLTTTYDQIPPVIVGDPPLNFLGHRILLVNGVWRERPFETGGFWRAEHFHQYTEEEAGYFLFGKIIYRDGNKQNRRIGILRRLDVGGRRFRPLSNPDPDYEYDD